MSIDYVINVTQNHFVTGVTLTYKIKGNEKFSHSRCRHFRNNDGQPSDKKTG